ncbi:hypothetical protein L6452_00257 [Arctium lappa]|uniref:Uncharacterized protein n=1 Tax=Arctium lappa TaxID=4217 RepID=A0ACB9FDC4_ARCLA|nr:hypothetical protein L6452_00257 [Arctium lappa]
MEGVGSRLSRASSRYGSTPVFTGPVRRWQKQWIHVSSSSPISYNRTTNFNSLGNKNNLSDIRLRRWTPVPTSHSGGDSAATTEERPRRKLRYTPIVVLEEKKNKAEKINLEVKASKTNQPNDQETCFHNEAQGSDKCEATIRDLNLKDYDEDHGSDRSSKEVEWVKAARTGFAR